MTLSPILLQKPNKTKTFSQSMLMFVATYCRYQLISFPQSLLMFAAVFSVAGCSLWDVGIIEIIDTADRTGIHDMKYKVEATAQASVTWKLVLYKVAAVILSFQPGRLQFFETSFDPTVRHTVWTQVQHKWHTFPLEQLHLKQGQLVMKNNNVPPARNTWT